MIANPYLNFDGTAEEAFRFYQSIFGGELTLQKMRDIPDMEIPESEKDRCMHASLPLGNSQFLMASDCVPSMGQVLKTGNNNYISLSVNSREEADRIFSGLSDGGTVEMPMSDMFWGDYFGSFVDKFGICWMISFNDKYMQ
jgi:PhnB protein